ncbi:MAG: HAD-IA family hydrolase [Gammaproteobacteria bacterium]|nr:HAD-IA family hydrolase [Gammaproteobacteria bacterium]
MHAEAPSDEAVIGAVLFDADGVIQEPSVAWRGALEALAGDVRRADDLLADIFAAEKPCLTGDEDFETALAGVLLRWNCATPVKEALRIWTMIDKDDQILNVIAQLRAQPTYVALATNQQAHRAGFMSEELGYAKLFDELFYSCELGYAKPDPEYFLAILGKLELAGENVLFLDDHEPNVSAAMSVGLHARVFRKASGVAELRGLLKEYDLDAGNQAGRGEKL